MDIADRIHSTGDARRSFFSEEMRRYGLAGLYAGTLFLAACLLFSVQPMFTKRVLPLLGGTPAVWSVAMVVFQTLLLAGYAYAHASIRWLPTRISVAVQIALLGCGFLALPIAIAAGFDNPPEEAGAGWLVKLFVASIGLPFFALSASSSLLQAWFVRASGRDADPYFLYRASNAGSLLALLAYPFLAEPLLRLDHQAALWSVGYVVLACAILACGLAARSQPATVAARVAEPPVALRRRLAWIGIAAVPSGLLVAATAHISTDVAAVPLLWVVPLALYLLSFIVAFRSAAAWPSRLLGGLQVGFTALEFAILAFKLNLSIAQIAIPLVLLLINGLIAHRHLYALRPPASRLTEFYLCTSLGGALGGIAAALVAPWLFNGLHEYPILLVAALACRPGLTLARWRLGRESLSVALVLIGAATIAGLSGFVYGPQVAAGLLLGILLFAFATNWREPGRVLAYSAFIGAATILLPLVTGSAESHRSFFGLHRVETIADGRFRLLWHGTTLHGAMRVSNDDGTPATGRPELLTYYTAQGPLAEVLETSRRVFGPIPSVSVVGLGTGTLACHSRPEERWRFFEIDPVVIRLATDPSRFRFLSACTPDAAIVTGDARLTLARQESKARVLILDAFSSDAIPMHLLTAEAVDVALGHLDAQGLVAFHISNRHFLLTHVLARIAAERGRRLLVRFDTPDEPFEQRLRARSRVAMMTDDAAVQAHAESLGWQVVAPDMSRQPWTDDFANPFEAMLDLMRQ